MNNKKSKPEPRPPAAAKIEASSVPPEAPTPASGSPRPGLFRRIDWIAFGTTTLLSLIGYMLTIAPDLTLEDSGELAVGSMYAGVPHPPGYPVWTIYTWLFTVLLPVSNIAFRVAVSSAVAGALSCGLVALMVSRGSSMMIEGIQSLKGLEKRWEDGLCIVSGFVAGMLIGFNGFMWSQSVIVEVYTLSVLSLTGVLVCVLRWIYAPQERRYLYFAFFWFGITFNNHQSLLVIALGLEIAVLAAHKRLGRELFFWNTLIWFAGLVAKWTGITGVLTGNTPLLWIYNIIGFASLVIWLITLYQTRMTMPEFIRDMLLVGSIGYFLVLLAAITHYTDAFHYRTGRLILLNLAGIAMIAGLVHYCKQTVNHGREWIHVLWCGGAWAAGAAFYLYMPLASMTNPPMNWGYPRTVEGFFHAFTRGQYERIHPTIGVGNNIGEMTVDFVVRCFKLVGLYLGGAMEEFNLVYLLIAILPFVFFRFMQKREKAWIIGLAATYFFLSAFLLILLNPQLDRQSRDLNRVFFTASHVIIAMGVGYGLTLIGAHLATQYERFRQWSIYFCAGAAVVALFMIAVVWQTGDDPFSIQNMTFDLAPSFEFFARLTTVFSLVLALAALAALFFFKQKAPMMILLVIFSLMPVRSIMSHWYDNEQRGHLFGYWFGHDMFTPPFDIYPEMTKDAILFGGTDPGRFNPTYMIFCESFIPDSKKRDPDFDRRDVVLITQNALADGTYLSYIRAHYNRSTQIDPPFFQELLRGPKERAGLIPGTNLIARAAIPVDRFFTDLGAKIEARRRADGVYPMEEIRTPTPDDSQRAFQEYLADAQRRLAHDRDKPHEPRQIKPGEDVRIIDNKVQVSGQVAVMSINALLTKIIFDANPDNEFFIEESFPLDWMYPYLTPFGIIMKLNREPIPEMTEEMVRKDHEFWSRYSDRLIGNWITYDTSIAEVCAFAEKAYYRHDHKDSTADPKFLRDSDGQKAFSKLRSSIAGIYAWRINHITSHVQVLQANPTPSTQAELIRLSAEQQRMLKEAEFAFKQAYAFCPYSPEAIFRFANLLSGMGRFDEALILAKTSQKLDPFNGQLSNLVLQLEQLTQRQAAFTTPSPGAPQMIAQITDLVGKYSANRADTSSASQALALLDQLVAIPQLDASSLLFAAQNYSQLSQPVKVESSLGRLVEVNPNNPEAWLDLAAMRALLQKPQEAIQALSECLEQNAQRLSLDPAATDLHATAERDTRFQNVRSNQEFQTLLAKYKR